MANLSLTDIVANSSLSSSVVNGIFAEIENALNGTNATDIDLKTGNFTTGGIIKLDVDGTDVNAAGSFTFGAGNDFGIYFDGSDTQIKAAAGGINITPASGSDILLDGTISVDAGVITGATSITSTAFVGDLTGDVTGNVSGTAATVTGAAQAAITSLGTLTTLTVDNITINGSAITHATAADLTITATAGNAVAIEGVSIDGGVVTGATSITSTAFVGDLTGNVTGNVSGTAATVTGATQANITTCANLVTVGALDSGSITSGFTSIDVGAGAISGGTITGTTLTDGTATLSSGAVSGVTTLTMTDTLSMASNKHIDMPGAILIGDNPSVTAATNNVVIGNGAGTALGVAANDNVAIGRNALATTTGGDQNICIGYNTGTNITATAGSNTLIGYSAGETIGNSNRNVMIGTYAGKYETASDSLYIDSRDRTNLATGRTDSLIYGTFNATAASQTLALNAGTITTLGSLQIAGALSGVTTLAASGTVNFGGQVFINYSEGYGFTAITTNTSSARYMLSVDTGVGNILKVYNDGDIDLSFAGKTTTFAGSVAVTGDIYTTAWTDYGSTSTVVGWTGETKTIWYKKVGDIVYVHYYITGTSDTTGASFTVPYTSYNGIPLYSHNVLTKDNGTLTSGGGSMYLNANTSTVVFYPGVPGTAWTSSGTKEIYGEFFYRAA